jgi:cyd operon protein YbgT
MWYFTWILGVLLACAFGIINVLWLEAQEALDQESIILDPLTRLPTRVRFLEVLENRIGDYKTDQIPFSMMFISMDAFRSLSEQEDNDVVNNMVMSIAEVIKKNIRLPHDFISRYDAATFTVILPGATATIAKTIAERICENTVEQTSIPTTESIISIGVAEYPALIGDNIDDSVQEQVTTLLEETDQACKNAQEQEKNSSCCANKVITD